MENINELLKEIVTTLKDTKTFVVDQAPDLVRQIVAYETTISWAWLVVLVVFLVTFIVSSIKCFKKFRDGDDGDFFGAAMFLGALALITLVLALQNMERVIKIETAPKLVLIEKVGELLKGK